MHGLHIINTIAFLLAAHCVNKTTIKRVIRKLNHRMTIFLGDVNHLNCTCNDIKTLNWVFPFSRSPQCNYWWFLPNSTQCNSLLRRLQRLFSFVYSCSLLPAHALRTGLPNVVQSCFRSGHFPTDNQPLLVSKTKHKHLVNGKIYMRFWNSFEKMNFDVGN